MQEPDDPEQNVPHLTFLRRLVTLLTLTMVVGIIVLVTLVFIRFQGEARPISLPDGITIPDGLRPVAFTQTREWYAIVTDDNHIVFFDKNDILFQTIKIKIP